MSRTIYESEDWILLHLKSPQGEQHKAILCSNSYTKTPKATIYRPATPIEKIHLEHSIESYTAHVQDNYFAHPETLSEVEHSFAAEVHGFQGEIPPGDQPTNPQQAATAPTEQA